MRITNELIEFVEELRKEAQGVAITRRGDQYSGWVDKRKLDGLAAGCRLLIAKLGPFGKVWDKMLQAPPNTDSEHVDRISGVLETIGNALVKGRLSTVEEAVSAEVLGDLLEHSEELIKSKYYLAAAVILRAILEERLRKLCESNGCMPTASKPTIEAFKQALYSANIIDKIGLKDIDWMAGIGNSAAHNLPNIKTRTYRLSTSASQPS